MSSKNITLPKKSSSFFEQVKNWANEHPSTIKVVRIAGLILGIGLLISSPFTTPLGVGIVVGLASTGVASIIASLVLFTHRPAQTKNTHPSSVGHKPSETFNSHQASLPKRDVNKSPTVINEQAKVSSVRSREAINDSLQDPNGSFTHSLTSQESHSSHSGQSPIEKTFADSTKRVTPGTYNSAQERSVDNAASRTALWKKLEARTASLKSNEDTDCLPIVDFGSKYNDIRSSAQIVVHRFTDVRCPKKTAVWVNGQYLHANHVGEGITQRKFIASQAPLKADFELFWQAVYEMCPTAIFDLRTADDQLRDNRAYHVETKYYPDQPNTPIKYGSIQVTLVGREPTIGGDIYTYQIQVNPHQEVRTIKRLPFPGWEDQTAANISLLCTLVIQVESWSPSPNDLTWIHCTAGVGRTGTLITALILQEKIRSGEITEQNLETSLENIIFELRVQRGSYFVQKQVQYELLLDYAHFLMNKKIKN